MSQSPPPQTAPDPATAPAGLALVESFVNTADLEAGSDAFADTHGLARWLHDQGLLDPAEADVQRDDLQRALRVREFLRALMLANHDGVAAADSVVGRLDRQARDLPLTVHFASDPPRLRPLGTGVEAALARILAIVYDATRDGAWSRMKVCRDDACRWAFYDASRNRSGKWCSMAVCGNRAKVRSYRQRHDLA